MRLGGYIGSVPMDIKALANVFLGGELAFFLRRERCVLELSVALCGWPVRLYSIRACA